MIKIQGVVQTGLGEGRKLGYPTANIAYHDTLKLDKGVYAGWCVVDGNKHKAAVVIGAREHNPTLLEVHIINFQAELIGKNIEVDILKKISDIEQFKSTRELKNKIKKDIRNILKLLV